jgi:iron complex transport system ATP-binding protein
VSAALSFEGVGARYAQRDALRDVTLGLRSGIVTGIVGPNGAGKTSLFRAALGLLNAHAGTIGVLGQPLVGWSREALARAIAYLPQSADAHWPIDAIDLVALGRLPHRAMFTAPSRADGDAVADALRRCDASAFAHRRMDELSAGERARVLFARALATSAPILLADEPAAYLDPAHQLRLMELLQEEAARGTAVAVTLHDLALASRHCDEIVVLHEGRVAAQGSPRDALSDAALAAVFGVTALKAADPSGGPAALVPWRRV